MTKASLCGEPGDLVMIINGHACEGGVVTTRTMAESRPPYDRYMVCLHLDCMEDQKDKLQAMLIAIRDAASAEDVALLHMIEVAKDIVENYAAWYRLRDRLGIKLGSGIGECTRDSSTLRRRVALRIVMPLACTA